jgi:hypothetical protein
MLAFKCGININMRWWASKVKRWRPHVARFFIFAVVHLHVSLEKTLLFSGDAQHTRGKDGSTTMVKKKYVLLR